MKPTTIDRPTGLNETAGNVGAGRRRAFSFPSWPCLAALSGIALAILAPTATAGEASPAPIPIAQRTRGEPYELSGKRWVFTNWFYIRPGSLAWVNDKGQGVTVGGDEGPWGAHFRRGDSPHGIRLVAQRGQRMGPILKSERPWESKGVSMNTLIQDQGKYRAWGPCWAGKSRGFAYFESADGLHWQRPEVGQVVFDGRKTNLLDVNFSEGSVFLDPSAPPDQRYKSVRLNEMSYEAFENYKRRRPDGWEPKAKREDVGKVFFIQGAVSPDGIRWTPLPEPLVVEHSDTQITAYFDSVIRKYVIYTRGWWVGTQSPTAATGLSGHWIGPGRRSIGRTESSDFRRFPLSELVLVPPMAMPPSDVLYTNCKTTIPGNPGLHLMFPTVWHQSDDTTSVVMASSQDGKLWDFVPGGPVFHTAPFGEWDGGCVFASPHLVELPDGSFALPYTGYNFPHKYPRGQLHFLPGYIVWPKGRLVGVEAVEHGEFATVAIVPPGRKLLVNAVVKRAGSLLVEVAGLDGTPLPGRTFADADPIVGDQYRKALTWKGQDTLAPQANVPILLRFRMDRATLFGLDFAD
jgi:hypothetical protein